jgi:hypothetical protein
MTFCFATIDELEVALYGMAARYHGFYERAAEQIGSKPVFLRQAMNPNYDERPSFVMRTAKLFIVWIKLHPRTGLTALQTLVLCIMTAAPDETTRFKIRAIERDIVKVRQEIEGVNEAIESLPTIRLAAREIVERRRIKRIKQPYMTRR